MADIIYCDFHYFQTDRYGRTGFNIKNLFVEQNYEGVRFTEIFKKQKLSLRLSSY